MSDKAKEAPAPKEPVVALKKFQARVRHWPLPSVVEVEAVDAADALRKVQALAPVQAENVELKEV